MPQKHIWRVFHTRAPQAVLVVKNLPANAEDTRDASSIPGSGRPFEGGHYNPLQYSCLENPMERGVWRGYTKSIRSHGVGHDWSDLASTHFLLFQMYI